MLEQAYTEICQAAMADPAGRGLAGHTTRLPPLAAIAESLAKARGVVLASGFPVKTEKGICGETDGPSGTAWLAGALTRLGVPVRVYTGANCAPQLGAALAFGAPKAGLRLLPHRCDEAWARQELEAFGASHFLSLERPGRGADGEYYNARGISISDMTADADRLLAAAKALGLATLAVGDGGNELGMGGCRGLVEAYVPLGKKICADLAADQPLVAGVSNWWGWGLAAALSVYSGQDLLPSARQESDLLAAVLAAGSVDGATRRFEPTVDGMPLEEHLEVLARMARALTLAAPAR